MKSTVFKSMVAAMALVSVGSASAFSVWAEPLNVATETVFSQDLLGFLNADHMVITPYAGASVSADVDIAGLYTHVAVGTPVVGLKTNTPTGAVLNVFTYGGFTLTAPALDGVSSGGTLTVAGLTLDLVGKTISGNVIGGNGVGLVSNTPLWTFGSMKGGFPAFYIDPNILIGDFSYTPGPHPDYMLDASATLSGLSFTASSLSLFTQSLGLTPGGSVALAQVKDFGTITAMQAVPEPSTVALLGLGLVGVACINRRCRQKYPAMTAATGTRCRC